MLRRRRVGWGRTTTYGTLAKELGAEREGARDVGQAMAKNPVALIIPCHRVLAAGGKVGGFSAPGGSAAKIRMLALEGNLFRARTSSGSAIFWVLSLPIKFNPRRRAADGYDFGSIVG